MENKKSLSDLNGRVKAVNDAMYVLSGRWKIAVFASLCFYNKRRFADLLMDIKGISNKMLSKELKELEMNRLVKRTILDTRPITVQYELTEYAQKLKVVIQDLSLWGSEHRQEIFRNR